MEFANGISCGFILSVRNECSSVDFQQARRAGTAVECRAFGAPFKCNPIPALRPVLLPTGPSGLSWDTQLFMSFCIDFPMESQC